MAELPQLRKPAAIRGNSNETYLFRHPEQFEQLAEYFAGALQAGGRDSFWALSAGASKGLEAISIVLTYLRKAAELEIDQPPPLTVIAIDAEEYNQLLFEAEAVKYSQVGQAIHYAIFDLRDQEKLATLKAFTPGARGFDAVFFNNTMTYFGNDDVGAKVCRTLRDLLLPTGQFHFFA
jgi:chemotaxis methyl-accepting protein methylase